jgi:hypothetical protein
MGKGIDYGMGQVNVDRATGIRYGVIHQHDLAHWALVEFEADYGSPTCGHCGADAVEYDNEAHGDYDCGRGCSDFACEECEKVFDSSDAYGDEPISHNLDDGEYLATMDQYGDIFILKSPYYTRAGFCSPCAPGACHLSSPCDDGEKCFCFGHDWFEGDKAPYTVYRVSDDTEVTP